MIWKDDAELVAESTKAFNQMRASMPLATDRATIRFLLADAENPSSVLSSLGQARENFRTTRDLAPSEAWRCVNELYLSSRTRLPRAVSQRGRNEALRSVIGGVQQLRGLMADTMSHAEAYQFIRIGRNIERADMTTRIIDSAATMLLSGREHAHRFDNTMWMAVLKSLSGYQMYRQSVRRRIHGTDVVAFLLKDLHFPRSFARCLHQIESGIDDLPHNAEATRAVARLRRIVGERAMGPEDVAVLHDFLDELQLELGAVHAQITATWFLRGMTS
jgi:uncharacterized alpha-E superfamily protein